MEILKVKEALTEVVKCYAEKISEIGLKCVADVYFSDDKGIVTSDEPEEISDSICASITVSAEYAKDENDRCGFDIVLGINKNNEINDSEMDSALLEFKADLDKFVEELAAAEDKNAFIKSASEREKAEYSEKMEKFNKDIKKLQTVAFTLLGVVLTLVLIGVFALISSL